MPPPKKVTTPVPVAVVRKGLISSLAYDALSPADKKESHRLEFVFRQAIVFGPTNYLYHATSTTAVPSIKISGLTTRDARGLPFKDASKDAFISAARTEGGAGSLSSSSTLLRFKPSLIPGTPPWKAYGAVGGEVRTMSPVPANMLQKKSGTTWVAL